MHTTPLYIYVKKGTGLKPGSLCGDCAVRADYVSLPNGDAVGVLHATSAKARKTLEAEPGITVLPPLHRPIKPEHVALFSHAGAAQGDTTYDVAEKLFQFHRMPWFHPESSHDSHDSIAELLG